MKFKFFLILFVFVFSCLLNGRESSFALKNRYDSGGISREELFRKAQELGYSLSEIKGYESNLDKSLEVMVEGASDSLEILAEKDSVLIRESESKIDETKSAFFKKDSTSQKTDLKYFGYDIFKKEYKAEREGLVNPDYQVGPGDKLTIVLWGRTELRYELKISREGTLFIPNVGQLGVNGLTLKSLRKKLINVMSRVYENLRGGRASTFLDVSLDKMKAINIFISGEVEIPGSYRVSSYSSVFTALYKIGGPTLNGSLRKIELIRNGKIVTEFDLYNYILSGNKGSDIKLQNNDNIFIPKRLSTISLQGEVTTPAVFELTNDETLRELIAYSGGLNTVADPHHVRIERIIPFEKRKKGDNIYQVIDEQLSDISPDKLIINPLKLYNKDFITVYKGNIFKAEKSYISIYGHVKNPGKYNLYQGMRVSDLLLKGGGFSDKYFFEQTFLNRADLIRYDDRMLKTSIIPLNIGAILNGNKNSDYLLKERDELKIYSIDIIHDNKVVSIFGEVRKEGEYQLSEKMIVNDLVLLSGGYTKKAYPFEIEVFRIDPYDIKGDSLVVVYRVETGTGRKDFYKSRSDFFLQDRDIVVVREYPDYQYQRKVFISGEVFRPGVYPLLRKEEGLRSLIDRAGGLKEESFIEGIELVRDSVRLAADFDKVLNSWIFDNDIKLKGGDSIYVPSHPGVVYIEGAVNNPGAVKFVEGATIRDYIEAAGSFHINADLDIVVCYGPGGKSKEYKWYKDSVVLEGSRIFVAKKEIVEPQQPTDWTDILQTMATVLTSVATLIIVIGNN